ncbi:MAG TPA: hypothetical protein PLV92_04340 [Pirellulaceae bacterium]|nr:hypothetical protein [Pirellulaceae bacterium]
MAKRNKSEGQPALAHYWTPPTALPVGDVGPPWACLATTFEFNAEYFESELLPRFLGLRFDLTENEPTFLVEREEALALTRVAALVDQSRFDSQQSTLRWDQLPIRIPNGIQHAKITVLAWRNFVRILVGSANITREGYRRNREIFTALDFWNGQQSAPRRLLIETLDLLALLLDWAHTAKASIERTGAILDDLRRVAREWSDAPDDFTPRERPRATWAVTHPSTTTGRPARSALRELLQQWGTRRVESVRIVTPFTARDSRSSDPVVELLGQLAMSRDCKGYLVVPELPRAPEEPERRIDVPIGFKASWESLLGRRGGSFVLPIPACVEGREARNRPLHAKCVLLESESDDIAQLMVGSSNFTPRGMGLGVQNFEANLIFEDVCSKKRDGRRLSERVGLPISWDESLPSDEVIWQVAENRADDEPDSLPALPGFFAWATYSQTTGRIALGLDRTHAEPSQWSVRLPGLGTVETMLFVKSSSASEPEANPLVNVLPAPMRAVNITSLLVEWQDVDGGTHSANLGVTVEGVEHLLPAEQFRKLGPDAIIECLITGKSPAQWFDQQQGRLRSAKRPDAAIESLRAVDTSSLLLYRVRRFGRALNAMARRILDTLPVPGAIRYRLLQDPFGPLTLARSVMNRDEVAPDAISGDDASWSNSLSGEQRLFLLAELLLMVAKARRRATRLTRRGKERRAVADIYQEAIQQLRRIVDESGVRGGAAANVLEYVRQVEAEADVDESTEVSGTVTDEATIASPGEPSHDD